MNQNHWINTQEKVFSLTLVRDDHFKALIEIYSLIVKKKKMILPFMLVVYCIFLILKTNILVLSVLNDWYIFGNYLSNLTIILNIFSMKIAKCLFIFHHESML